MTKPAMRELRGPNWPRLPVEGRYSGRFGHKARAMRTIPRTRSQGEAPHVLPQEARHDTRLLGPPFPTSPQCAGGNRSRAREPRARNAARSPPSRQGSPAALAPPAPAMRGPADLRARGMRRRTCELQRRAWTAYCMPCRPAAQMIQVGAHDGRATMPQRRTHKARRQSAVVPGIAAGRCRSQAAQPCRALCSAWAMGSAQPTTSGAVET